MFSIMDGERQFEDGSQAKLDEILLDLKIARSVNGFSLDLGFEAYGGALGILGASGSGKSMTLRCIAGIETPDFGRIALNNRVLFDSEKGINVPPADRRIGILFQDYALFPHLTVSENIAFGPI